MPDLFRVKRTYWVDGNGKRVKVSTPGATKTVEKSKDWYAEMPFIESTRERIVRRKNGKKKPKGKRVRLCQNKRAAQTMLREMIDAAERKAAGVVNHCDRAEEPLGDLVDRYRDHLLAKGNGESYAGTAIGRIETVLGACRFLRIGELDSEKAATWLYQQRQEKVVEVYRVSGIAKKYQEIAEAFGVGIGTVTAWKKNGAPIQPRGKTDMGQVSIWYNANHSKAMGAATSNHYVTALRGFGKWLWRYAKIVEKNPFEMLDKIDAKSDIRKSRRALEPRQFARFVDATRTNPKTCKGLSGSDRAVLYMLAAFTGLRASEIASTSRASFKLSKKQPIVTVKAAYTKNSKLARIPLESGLVVQLKMYFENIQRDEGPIWPGNWYKTAADMVRRDLKRAGIPYTDENGDDYDFHALRHQFITDLARAGVSLNLAKELARHSKVDLTANIYTHLSVEDQSAAVEKLGQIRSDRSPLDEGLVDETDAEFASVPASVGSVKRDNLSDKSNYTEAPPEKSG